MLERLPWADVPAWLILVVVLAGLLALQTLSLWWLRGKPARVHRERMRRAVRAEKQAERLLRKQGFRILDRQVEGGWAWDVDGERHRARLRADLLVTRAGRRYVAEVKSGSEAPSASAPATRRQLLEYRLAYNVDGVLLVDMEEHRLREVRFFLPATSRPAWGWLLAGAGLGACLAAWLIQP